MVSALYRRYRPETFAEMIGQSHVTDPLRAALRHDRIGQAYLFSGPRGCGKTTSARILARCLNCVEGPTDTPCGVCPSCIELSRDGGGSLDVVEIDAASHGGVEDARDLRERATFAPARDRYKIFIIDEAHMVSPQGFNALLKIVEEPPEHIKFLFATTEPEKVIGTIRSRTHHYPFRLIPPAQLLEYVQQLCVAEGVSVEPGVLPLVVRAGGGSARDTLSLLDQLIAGSESDTVLYARAVALLGFTHASLLDEVVDALSAKDSGEAFVAVDRVVQTGQDPRRFVEDLLERLRDLVVVAATGPTSAAAVLRGASAEDIATLAEQASRFGQAGLSRAADIANSTLNDMTGTSSPRLHLELMIARVLLPESDEPERGALARVERLERRVGVEGADPRPAPAPAQAAAAAPASPAPAATPAAANPAAAASPVSGQPVSTPAVSAATAAASAWDATTKASTKASTDASTGAAAGPPTGSLDSMVLDSTVPDSAVPDSTVPAEAALGSEAAAMPAPGAPATTEAVPAPSAAPAAGGNAAPPRTPSAAGGVAPVAPPSAPVGVEQMRDTWPEILERVQNANRHAWLVAFTATVRDLQGDVLTLTFPSQSDVDSFKPDPAAPGASVSEVLRTAILDVLGIRVKYIARVEPGGRGGTPAAAPVPALDDPEPVAPATRATDAASSATLATASVTAAVAPAASSAGAASAPTEAAVGAAVSPSGSTGPGANALTEPRASTRAPGAATAPSAGPTAPARPQGSSGAPTAPSTTPSGAPTAPPRASASSSASAPSTSFPSSSTSRPGVANRAPSNPRSRSAGLPDGVPSDVTAFPAEDDWLPPLPDDADAPVDDETVPPDDGGTGRFSSTNRTAARGPVPALQPAPRTRQQTASPLPASAARPQRGGARVAESASEAPTERAAPATPTRQPNPAQLNPAQPNPAQSTPARQPTTQSGPPVTEWAVVSIPGAGAAPIDAQAAADAVAPADSALGTGEATVPASAVGPASAPSAASPASESDVVPAMPGAAAPEPASALAQNPKTQNPNPQNPNARPADGRPAQGPGAPRFGAAPVSPSAPQHDGPQRYGESVVREILGATFVEEQAYSPPVRGEGGPR